MVRHYEVNRYLQTHYRPVVSVDGFLFLLRDDLPFDAATDPRAGPERAGRVREPRRCADAM